MVDVNLKTYKKGGIIMEKTIEKFTKTGAIESVIEVLESFDGYYSDLHSETFNTDYYIIGTYEAKKALESYGVFEAIEKVKEYETNVFGEVHTKIECPESLANMLWYVIGEEVMAIREVSEFIYNNEQSDNKLNLELINILKNAMEDC